MSLCCYYSVVFLWFIYKTCKQQAKADTSGKKKPKAASTGKKKSGTSKQKKDEIVSVFLVRQHIIWDLVLMSLSQHFLVACIKT